MANKKISQYTISTTIKKNDLFDVSRLISGKYYTRRIKLETIETKILTDPTVIGTATIPTAAITTGNITTGNITTLNIPDSGKINIGDGNDGQIYVSSDDLYIDNVTLNKNIIIRANVAGVQTIILTVDGSNKYVNLPDDIKLTLGNFDNGRIYFDSSSSDLYIDNGTANKDTIFRGNDGGGLASILIIDGALNYVKVPDTIKLTLGTGNDGQIYSSSDDLYIQNTTQDKDILFLANDGGLSYTMLQIDGSESIVRIPDSRKLTLGTGDDGQIYSSSDNFYIENATQDKDIYVRINDGGTNYSMLFVDGSTSRVAVGQNFTTPLGVFHAQFTAAAENPYFERVTTFAAVLNSACTYKATTSANMTDGHGAAFFIAIQDDTSAEENIVAFGGARDGADDSGKAQIGTYSGGAVAVQFEIMNDGGIFANSLLGAAPGGNPAVYYNSGTNELFYDSSSIEEKEKVSDLAVDDISYLLNLKCRKYDRKDGSVIGEHGFIAEEVLTINNKLVNYIPRNRKEINEARAKKIYGLDFNVEIPEPDWKPAGVDKLSMVADLVKAYQLLHEEVNFLKSRMIK